MDNMAKAWNVILMGLAITVIVGVVMAIRSPKHTVRYELSSYNQNTLPAIRKDIENGGDENIYLSKEISWSKAVQLVDSLNQSLHFSIHEK